MGQITDIMEKLLYEFAVTRVDYDIPKWVQLLPYDNYVKQAVITYAKTFLARASKLKDVAQMSTDMQIGRGYIESGISCRDGAV